MFNKMITPIGESGGNIPRGFISTLSSATIQSAVASSTYPDSRFTVDHSYDNSSATAWMPDALGNNVPYNVIYDLGSAQNIYAIFLQWAASDTGVYSEDIEILGSTTGTQASDFTSIISATTMTIQNPWTDQGSGIPTQGNIAIINKSLRHIKIAFKRNSGSASYCTGIGEIKFLLST